MLKEKEELREVLEQIVALERTVSLEKLLRPMVDGEVHYPSQRVGFQAKALIQHAKVALGDLNQE